MRANYSKKVARAITYSRRAQKLVGKAVKYEEDLTSKLAQLRVERDKLSGYKRTLVAEDIKDLKADMYAARELVKDFRRRARKRMALYKYNGCRVIRSKLRTD